MNTTQRKATLDTLQKGNEARRYYVFTRDQLGNWQPAFGPDFYVVAEAKTRRLRELTGIANYAVTGLLAADQYAPVQEAARG